MRAEQFVSQQSLINEKQVKACIELLEKEYSIPFIARYRKEITQNLDDTEIESISNNLKEYNELEKRRAFIIGELTKNNNLTEELKKRIEICWEKKKLEQIYQPFVRKKISAAEKAKQRGLLALANIAWEQKHIDNGLIAKFVKNDLTKEEVLEGTKILVAYKIADDEGTQNLLWEDYQNHGKIQTKRNEKVRDEKNKFKDYYNLNQLLKNISSHRFLAIQRAEKLEIIKVKIDLNKEILYKKLAYLHFRKKRNLEIETAAIKYAVDKILHKQMSRMMLNEKKEVADNESIKLFKKNLVQLLIEAPLGRKRVLAIDPGFRTGCKIVCLDERGNLLHNSIIYLHKESESKKRLSQLVEQYKIDTIAIGNGTASRETAEIVKNSYFKKRPELYIVSESGASIYSTSTVAREEFPNFDPTVRSSISIGRRLQDPLAELVKLEPKTIGVGQYQHDVNKKQLGESLEQTVINTVNKIGVNLNTASIHLLQYVSGIGSKTAENIITYREEKGGFSELKELHKINKIGDKTFQQAAGFLRITDGKNKLDETGIHPETYTIVEEIAKSNALEIRDLVGNKELLEKINPREFCSQEFGEETICDIISELINFKKSTRKELKEFQFNKDIKKIEDLEVGSTLPGIVNNITKFGAFVDIGIKENGLLHISEICKEYGADINDFININEKIEVVVKSIDIENKRIQLSK